MKLKQDASLFLYQRNVLNWMRAIKRSNICGAQGGVIFMKMGLGKTIVSLEYLKQSINKSNSCNLVICSKILINEWKNQIEKFYEEKPKVFILHNDYNKIKNVTVEQLQQYNIILTTYQTICNANKKNHMFSDIYINKETNNKYYIDENQNTILKEKNPGIGCVYQTIFNSVIIDECQNVSNKDSLTFRSIYSLARNETWCLSGTPIKNNKLEFISILKLLKVNGFNFPSQWKNEIIPSKVWNLFKHVTYNNNMELPKINYNTIKLNMNKKTKAIYKNYVEQLWDEYNKMIKKGENKISKLIGLFTRLRQICITPYLLKFKEDSMEQYKKLMKQDDISRDLFYNEKLNETINILKEKTSKGEKVIIFTYFSSYLYLLKNVLQKNGIENTIIKATDNLRVRDQKIENYKKSKDNNVLLMNYKIGSEGLNLTEANNIILLDSWWNFVYEEQAIARVHRTGQTKEVNVYKIMMNSSFEELMYKLSLEKKDLFSKLKNNDQYAVKIKLDKDTIFRWLLYLMKNIKEEHKV
jgi:SNF2 family DNA or RNA helicase